MLPKTSDRNLSHIALRNDIDYLEQLVVGVTLAAMSGHALSEQVFEEMLETLERIKAATGAQ